MARHDEESRPLVEKGPMGKSGAGSSPISAGWLRVFLAFLAAASWMVVSSMLIIVNKQVGILYQGASRGKCTARTH